MELLDPTSEQMPEGRQPLPRLSNIEGAVIGLLDISKPKGNVFLDRIEMLLNEQGRHHKTLSEAYFYARCARYTASRNRRIL